MHILVVDDEEDLRFTLRFVLELEGHEVNEAADGESALEAIRVRRPDLLVTDRMMPRMTGTVLIEHLRADPATASLPIIMWSANPDITSAADAHVLKTTGMDGLKERIREIADARVDHD